MPQRWCRAGHEERLEHRGISMGPQVCLLSWGRQSAPLRAGDEGNGAGVGAGDGAEMG